MISKKSNIASDSDNCRVVMMDNHEGPPKPTGCFVNPACVSE